MSCLSSTAPINIDAEKQSGTCDLKCNYQFRYSDSVSTATNRGDYISLNYEPASGTPPVRFNSNEYIVSEIRIYTPSLHTFRGNNAKGECIIVHTSNSGKSPLLVCIPILSGSNSSLASQYLSRVINTMSKTAIDDSETTRINKSFNLNDFVPLKPFFSYTATQPYQPCRGENNYVVFIPSDSVCSISDTDFETMSSVIHKNAYKVIDGTPFFYNSQGPGQSLGSGDDIYIDCQPVGQSDETTETLYTNSDDDTSNIFQGDVFKYLLIFLVFLAILFAFNYLLNYLGNKIERGIK